MSYSTVIIVIIKIQLPILLTPETLAPNLATSSGSEKQSDPLVSLRVFSMTAATRMAEIRDTGSRRDEQRDISMRQPRCSG